ncbi:NitT/TauT family transport system substrate-binding protein [Marinactinospora thermotolerans DSM 45154]|uniref:NitT/TauT family transport system substrate-binding protein n=1 Tax=Marinactinospora thermotolerans DSM 45154 TaxID=1122192 RepID=A0A1T4LU34_9ACTN|nr:ABC transporter substrate-binding protein [Marinactinospora thermotolerans]SJZ58240.1 NitT/TauT family transport system substrate-binding protein [Marinactinospora thermotolerans DSM 45154]
MRRTPLALAGTLLLAATTACGGGGPTEEGGLTQVTVGAIPIIDVAPIYLGQEQGFFEERGIELTIESTSGGAAAVPGVVSGNFQFAFGNVTSLIIGRQENLPLKIVTNGVTSSGQDGADFGAIVVPEGSDITSPEQLEGATVAVNNLKNIGDTTVRNSVELAGGDGSGIEFVELAFPDMPAALDNNQVDAAWVVEPHLTTALRNGATEIASNFVDASPDLSVAAYFTSEQTIAENPELVDAFTEAMTESLEYADANPDEVRRILSTYTEIAPEVIEELRLPRFPAEVDRASVQTVADLMVEHGTLDEAPDLDALYR